MHEEDEIRPHVVPLEGGQVNLDTAGEFGLSFRDFPEIRESIRKYAVITVAAQLVLNDKARQHGGSTKYTVLLVRDTKELLVDGRPAVDVVYSTQVAMPLRNGVESFTEHIQVPIETISGLVARLENGDIPFSPDPDRAVGFNQ
jgi:hypothetical protein